jgi:hypothetical protein
VRKGGCAMKRLIMLVTVVLLVAAMLVLAGPASAQAGCKEFGQWAAENAPHTGAPVLAPINDDVFFLKAREC